MDMNWLERSLNDLGAMMNRVSCTKTAYTEERTGAVGGNEVGCRICETKEEHVALLIFLFHKARLRASVEVKREGKCNPIQYPHGTEPFRFQFQF